MTTLNVQDLELIAQIIEIAITRNAFSALEIATVGATYEKLYNFVQESKQQLDTQQGD